MKKLGNSVIILLGIVLVAVLIAYLLPQKMHVERSISMKSSVDFAFDKVNVLENWKEWSPWHKLDSAIKINFEGKSGKGASFNWSSTNKNVGSGNILITECKKNEFLSLDMDLSEYGKASSYFRFESRADSLKVSWGFDSDLGKNPFRRYFGGRFRKSITENYIIGLTALKDICENQSAKILEMKRIIPEK